MELIDIYDDEMNKIGTVDRNEAHAKGLWHKCVHCWLYDEKGNIYFQIRNDSGKLYTTASGHVRSGESIQDAFAREIKEEIGLESNSKDAELIELVVWRMDAEKNGLPYIDRAYSSIYIKEFDGDFAAFNFDPAEVKGIVRVDVKDCIRLLQAEQGTIEGTKIYQDIATKEKKVENIMLQFEDFERTPSEIAIIKFGRALNAVLQKIYK